MELINITIKSRKKILYQGKALYLTSVNDNGKFDILPQHANFISLIKDFIIIRKEDEQDEKIDIKTGVLKNINNIVSVYLNTGRKK